MTSMFIRHLLAAHNAGYLQGGLVLRGHRQSVGVVQPKRWKTFHFLMGVAEHDPTDAMAIHQHDCQPAVHVVGRAFLIDVGQQCISMLPIEHPSQQRHGLDIQRLAVKQQHCGVGPPSAVAC
ncbi:hypothetical protein [Sodalis-like endosymbiont of Proechinophthirus fluctus]|uniref:hypothetical protein n=1 Tax=Sodalis-like endosymbiont of Proechinophthirus fluctus TaxID=1462730 RepID=UPI00195E5D3F|nr:hypothetical protein [Sodalis-like endosymbiont of Proechinophthirus fluctus]